MFLVVVVSLRHLHVFNYCELIDSANSGYIMTWAVLWSTTMDFLESNKNMFRNTRPFIRIQRTPRMTAIDSSVVESSTNGLVGIRFASRYLLHFKSYIYFLSLHCHYLNKLTISIVMDGVSNQFIMLEPCEYNL